MVGISRAGVEFLNFRRWSALATSRNLGLSPTVSSRLPCLDAIASGAWVCVRNLRPHRCLPRGNHGSRSWLEVTVRQATVSHAVAHGGNHGSRSWGEPPRPRCLPKTALPPQDRAASPRPHCDPWRIKFATGRTWGIAIKKYLPLFCITC